MLDQESRENIARLVSEHRIAQNCDEVKVIFIPLAPMPGTMPYAFPPRP